MTLEESAVEWETFAASRDGDGTTLAETSRRAWTVKTIWQALLDAERDGRIAMIRHSWQGSVAATAAHLGISRYALLRQMKRLGLPTCWPGAAP